MSNGLSQASFLGGAMQGYDFMDRQFDKRDQKQRQERVDERQDEQWEMQKDTHQVRMDQAKREERLHGLKIDQFEQEQADRANRLLAMTLAHGGADALEGDDAEFANLHPNFNAARLLSDDFGQALEIANQAFEGQIDPNSPEAMQALETLVPEISLGSGGGRKVRPVGIVPGKKEGTFMVNLAVDGDNEPRPLTQDRSARDDDPVAQIPLDSLAARIAVAERARQQFQNPGFREAFIRNYYPEYQEKQTAGELEKHPELGWVQRQPDGTLKQYDPADGGVSGGSSSDPAAVKTVQFLIDSMAQEGVELSTEQAWDMYKTASSDPTRYVADYVKMQTEAQNTIGYNGEKKTPEQLEDEAIKSYQRIRQQMGSRGGQGQNVRERDPRTQESIDNAMRMVSPPQSGQSGQRGGPPASIARPQTPRREAPPEALEELRANPTEQMKQDFMDYFGYLPDDI